jgi:hypothetical protein
MPTRRIWSAAATAVIGAALLVACDSETPPSPPSSTTPPPTTTANTTSTAPRVRQPLDGAAFAAAACTSLTDAQRADLQLSGGREDARTASCTYTDLDPATELDVQVLYPGFGGLAELYASHGDAVVDEWTPTEIDGYPAVHFLPRKAANVCDLGVGINDSTYFYVRVIDQQVEAGRDTCGQATTIGAAVLTTIKAAN